MPTPGRGEVGVGDKPGHRPISGVGGADRDNLVGELSNFTESQRCSYSRFLVKRAMLNTFSIPSESWANPSVPKSWVALHPGWM